MHPIAVAGMTDKFGYFLTIVNVKEIPKAEINPYVAPRITEPSGAFSAASDPLTAREILDQLSEKKLQSVIIEGGTKTLQHFIDANLWDEARIFVTKAKLKSGLKGPNINRSLIHNSSKINEDILITLYSDSMISKSS